MKVKAHQLWWWQETLRKCRTPAEFEAARIAFMRVRGHGPKAWALLFSEYQIEKATATLGLSQKGIDGFQEAN